MLSFPHPGSQTLQECTLLYVSQSTATIKFNYLLCTDILIIVSLQAFHRNVYTAQGNEFYFLIFSGVRFRRQHWCLLSILLLIIVLGIAIGIHVNSSAQSDVDELEDLKKAQDEIQVSIPTTEEGRIKAVKQMLKEVPLIDG